MTTIKQDNASSAPVERRVRLGMINKRIKIIAAIIYVVVAIVTFGDSAVFFEKRGIAEVEYCRANAVNPMWCDLKKSMGFAALASTVAWPFYWSYRFAYDG